MTKNGLVPMVVELELETEKFMEIDTVDTPTMSPVLNMPLASCKRKIVIIGYQNGLIYTGHP